jgi:hypothetical protein
MNEYTGCYSNAYAPANGTYYRSGYFLNLI